MLSTNSLIPFSQVEVGQSFYLADPYIGPLTDYTYTRIDPSDDLLEDNCIMVWAGGEATTMVFGTDLVELIPDTDTPSSPDMEWL